MAEPASLFILAGEASGDRIGAALLEGLRARRALDISGVGGEEMTEQGLVSLFPMRDLSVMGFADVVRRLPLLLWRLRQVTRTILRTRPDCVVLIDSQVFSQTIASRLRKAGYTGRIVLYVAPSVWAYRPERARTIAPLYDEVLAVLPFEPKAMADLGGPETVYVGHPALDRFPFRPENPASGPLMLLPGSRTGELRRHLPLMRAVAEALAGTVAVEGFVIPTPRALHETVAAMAGDWSVPVTIVSDATGRADALRRCIAAFAVSGTATLELALAGVPHAITYVAESWQVKTYRKSGTTPWIGLPNILAAGEVAPELIFAGEAEPERAIVVMRTLASDASVREAQRAAFQEIRSLMQNGAPEAPRLDPVDRIAALLD